MKTIEEIDAIIERFEIEDLIDTLRACATRVMALAPHLTLVPSLTGMQLACQHCGEQQPQPLGDLNQVCLTVAGIALRHRRCQPGMSRSTLAPPIKPIEFSNWVASPLTGTAAATIYRILSHLPTPQYARDDIPRDVHDFLRCVDLLDLQNGALCQQSSAGSVVPGVGTQRWQLRLSELAARVPAWAGITQAWDQLEILARAVRDQGMDSVAVHKFNALFLPARGE